MNKTAIKSFAVWARRKLISDITYKAGMLGITEAGIAQPMAQSTKDLQFFDIGTKDYVEISGAEIQQRNALISAIRMKEKTTDYKTAFRSIVEEVAYTWFNRLIAVRFMEVNDYLPSHVRVLSSSNPNKLEPDFVTTPFETDMEFSAYEKDVVLQLKDQNKLDELFRMLFIGQCNKLSQILPELFEQISDYTELLLTISFTDKDGVIYHLTHDIAEDDFNVEKEGQVEIIGWLYQYYNTEPKDEVFALLKKNVKITKECIPAATQIFTPDWIVRYMVENSLGRLWVAGHPNDDLKAAWKYYLEEAEQEPEVQEQLKTIRESYAKINPEDIKVIDPCMGSGHILVYAFDVLVQIYTSYGYTQRDAAKSILKNNLYGIDIDTRAYQLAYFAVMMKARQYSRRIFEEGIMPNLMAVKNSVLRDGACLKRLGDLEELGRRLVTDFKDAEEYGSILQLNYTQEELDALDERLDRIDEMADYGNLVVQMESAECVNTIAPLVRQARIMCPKYDVVVTNPPYMGNGGMPGKLNNYMKEYYPESKADLFSAFIIRAVSFMKEQGYTSMITPQSLMFIGGFETHRRLMLNNLTITSMAYMGFGAFGADFGTTAFTFAHWNIPGYIGSFKKLDTVRDILAKERLFLDKNETWLVNIDQVISIPGMPLAFWVKNVDMFKHTRLEKKLVSGGRIKTHNNAKYVRGWWEVEASSHWIPYANGGGYRKWYGNYIDVVDWSENAVAFYERHGGLINPKFLHKEGITWNDFTSKSPSYRIKTADSVYSSVSPTVFDSNYACDETILGFLNSKVGLWISELTNPTVHTLVGDVLKYPDYTDDCEPSVKLIVRRNIELAKIDWDSYEISWDFSAHPMVTSENNSEYMLNVRKSNGVAFMKPALISDQYYRWKKKCDDRFFEMKSNEEELNRIYIKLYGLDDVLDPKVEERDITISRSEMRKDICSLISYAVGCMFGRYSLDEPGLIYAGGNWDTNHYHSFIPVSDNCILISEEEYVNHDIVGRFVDFIRTVYGEATLEENLTFIANTLGYNGRTARDTIRQYFVRDFFKDHCQTYSATGSGTRPIYWLFDSGKQNGFKALVYMHRWNADTVGNLRVEYLHKMQKVYEKEIESCQDIIDNSLNNREIAVATKRKEKLVKQLKECKDYDAKVAHIALSRIDIDLDDGVKVNYRKVQTGTDGKFCEILADSKDIMVKEDSPLWQSLISSK